MALGNTYNNNKQKEFYRPTVYGRSMSNTSDTAIEKTNLAFSMWKGTLKIAINPQVTGSTTDYPEWDRESQVAIYLTPAKSYMLAEIIKSYMKDKKTFNGYSVNAGKGLITICDGKELGGQNTCLVIRTVNLQGKVDTQGVYEVKQDSYFSVYEKFNADTGDYKQVDGMFENMELKQIVEQLEDYARFTNNAIAFTVCDSMTFQDHPMVDAVAKIANKLGVQAFGGQGGSHKNTSYFGNKDNVSAASVERHTGVIDEIVND